jgi:hypothetical protein
VQILSALPVTAALTQSLPALYFCSLRSVLRELTVFFVSFVLKCHSWLPSAHLRRLAGLEATKVAYLYVKRARCFVVPACILSVITVSLITPFKEMQHPVLFNKFSLSWFQSTFVKRGVSMLESLRFESRGGNTNDAEPNNGSHFPNMTSV